MKALSILQPWPYAILHLGKDIENRSWRTMLRGRFLIHAGKGFDHIGARYIVDELGLVLPETFERGGIVGSAVIRDCVQASDSKWFAGPGCYGFVLQAAKAIPFIPCRGALGFFDVPDHLVREVAA